MILIWYPSIRRRALTQQMTSIERICEYRELEQEAASHSDVSPPEDWPSQGEISMQHVSLHYTSQEEDGEGALKDVCLQIKPREKVIAFTIVVYLTSYQTTLLALGKNTSR